MKSFQTLHRLHLRPEELPIILIGTGNLANALGRVLRERELFLVGVSGRNSERIQKLAHTLRVEPLPPVGQDLFAWIARQNLNQTERWVLWWVEDDVFLRTEVSALLTQYERHFAELSKHLIHLHSSGSVPVSIFPSGRGGVIYPLMSFHRQVSGYNWLKIPLFVSYLEGHPDSREVQKVCTRIASRLSGKVYEIPDEIRPKIHLCAVVVNNFPALLLSMGFALVQKWGLQPHWFAPIVRETADRWMFPGGPGKYLTGPLARRDFALMSRYLQILEQEMEEFRGFWRALQTWMEDAFRNGDSPRAGSSETYPQNS